MRPPLLREKVLRELAVRGEISVRELLLRFRINKPYLYRILRSLENKRAIVLTLGKARVLDKKALIYIWGTEKKKIFQVIRGVTYRVRPKKVKDFVVFSGTSALWIFGKVLEPSFGTAYIRKEDYRKLKETGIERDGYPVRFYSYDEDIFNYTMDVKGYTLPVIEQILADVLGEGIYTRVIEELLEEMEWKR